MDFVVNEWLPQYFLPGAKPEEKRLLNTFVTRFLARRDQIVVLRPSPFTKKLDTYAKLYSGNQEVYAALKFFITTVLLNPACASLVSITDELPDETLAVLHESGTNYSSDEYLFHAAMRTETKMIITTDEKLFNALKDDPVFKVVLLRDFLAGY